MQTHTKKRNKDWAMFGDDLTLFANQAYPDLPDEARKRFVLNQYLSQLDTVQVAFGVRQAKPKAVDEPLCLTLEMESCMQLTRPNKIAATLPDDYESDVVGAASTQTVSRPPRPQRILEQMDHLQTELRSVQPRKVTPSSEGGGASGKKQRSRLRSTTC